MNKVYVVTGRTNSGDTFRYVFSQQPTDLALSEILRNQFPGDFAAFGDDGGLCLDFGYEDVIVLLPSEQA